MVRFKVKPKRGTYKPHHETHDEKTETGGGRGGKEMGEIQRERVGTDDSETVPPPCLPLLSSLLACFATTGDMRANEACSNAAKALHTCMAGSKGNVKASKSSVSLIHPRIFDPSFSFCGWILMIRSIIYLVRLVKAASPNLYFDYSPKEHQAGSAHTDEEKDGNVSISDLEYCCISIMHYSLRHASLTTPTMSLEKWEQSQEQLARINLDIAFRLLL
jgi:hypothetical protein